MVTEKCIKISEIRIDMVQIPNVINAIERWIVENKYGNYIVISNVNDVVTSRKSSKVKDAVNNSSLSVPDGISLVLLARLYGYPLKKRVYGPDLMLGFLKLAESESYSNFLYGSTQETLNLMTKNLKMKFPRLNIAGVYSPPFRELREDEDREIIDMINKASPDVLWVGLGCPKQQLWMYEHKDKLKVPVMVGIGAAFDFLAGTKRQAPRWMRDNGLEWLFRLSKEPKRLWKRYLIGNSLFIFLVLKEMLEKIGGKGGVER